MGLGIWWFRLCGRFSHPWLHVGFTGVGCIWSHLEFDAWINWYHWALSSIWFTNLTRVYWSSSSFMCNFYLHGIGRGLYGGVVGGVCVWIGEIQGVFVWWKFKVEEITIVLAKPEGKSLLTNSLNKFYTKK